MTIFINKERKSKFSPRVKISALHLYSQIGQIYATIANTNKLYEIRLGGLTKNLKTNKEIL